MSASHHLVQLRGLQSRLQDAREIYERLILFASNQATPILSGTQHAYLGDLKREWIQLDEASIEIQKGLELLETGDNIIFLTDVYRACIHLAITQKNWERAWNYLQKAKLVARINLTASSNIPG